ncbi:MAG TPA: M48 family metalloprotease [Vicinamibacterales bacterium]|nr:M48 family metalloprotease [Vicinamibacterales bacterium]
MTSGALILWVALATVALSAAAGNALVLLAGSLARGRAWTAFGARTAASLLVQARLAPLTLTLVCVPLVTLAFWRYEPAQTMEATGVALRLLAAGGVWVLVVTARRGWQSVRATGRVVRAWRQAGVPADVPGWQGRAWVVDTRVPVVAVVGVGRGELYVSADVLRACTTAEIAAIAAHERAHVTGRDNLTRVLFALAPAVRRAAARLERTWAATAEEIADLHARAGGDGVTLAQALTKVARLAPGATAAPPIAISAFIGGDDLEGRVRRLLEPARHPGHSLRGMPFAAVVPIAIAAAIWGLPEIYEAAEFVVKLGR